MGIVHQHPQAISCCSSKFDPQNSIHLLGEKLKFTHRCRNFRLQD